MYTATRIRNFRISCIVILNPHNTSMANNGGAGPSDMNCSMYSRRLNQPGSPESEFNNFECFQNYTAPEVFVQGLAGIVNQGDVEVMIRAQKQMYVDVLSIFALSSLYINN